MNDGYWEGLMEFQPTGISTGEMPSVRKNPQGYMGTASREHKVKKGKGSYTRKTKHKKGLDTNL